MNHPFKKNAKLVLSNGITFKGYSFGAMGSTVGEIVFNTGMTGYQEVITDPSYFGQILTFTYPEIGIQELISKIQNQIILSKA